MTAPPDRPPGSGRAGALCTGRGTMHLMEEVSVRPISLERLAAILPDDRAERLAAAAERARASFGDRVVWHVNATAHGGGVAEMLQTLLAYGKGPGIENRWMVLDGDPEFFAITKRLHNNAARGAGGRRAARAPRSTRTTRRCSAPTSRSWSTSSHLETSSFSTIPRPPGWPRACASWERGWSGGATSGRDRPNDLTRGGMGVPPAVPHAGAGAGVLPAGVRTGVGRGRPAGRHPSLDRPVRGQEHALPPEVVTAILARVGLVADGGRQGPVDFVRRDGSTGTVRPHRRSGGLLLGGDPPPADVPLVVQVSRWDRLKDMAGVMEGFVRAVADDDLDGAHLMLAGPEVSGVTDDPEGAEVLAECREEWSTLPEAVRGRVHLASIPMDDADENAIIVNALQRHAAVVVQKSLVEGFGLTVTEAMWKGRPVVASKVGGIQDQITDGRDGLLVEDPYDIEEFAGVLRGSSRSRSWRAAGRRGPRAGAGGVRRRPPSRAVRRPLLPAGVCVPFGLTDQGGRPEHGGAR